jgi:uncharacterized protein YxjI
VVDAAQGGLLGLLGDRSVVLVRQLKEWGEILVGLEGQNRYELLDEQGQRIGYAAEEAKGVGGWLMRNTFGRCRPATLRIHGPAGEALGRGEKPFRWFFHRMDIYDGDVKVGAIERKWSWLHRRFVLENAAGEELLEVLSPWLRIWTFEARFQGQKVGCIRKKWGGLLREWMTDADTFGVEFEAHLPAEARRLLLVATFLIDFAFFENNNRD